MAIDLTTPVDRIMRARPATIRVFLDHGMHCPGCPIASFHSVEDACREHGADRVGFLADLRAIADGAGPREPAPAGCE